MLTITGYFPTLVSTFVSHSLRLNSTELKSMDVVCCSHQTEISHSFKNELSTAFHHLTQHKEMGLFRYQNLTGRLVNAIYEQ